jgi:glycosyltransferase involved in cell wall biosynthesis
MNALSAVIITHNEARNIARCIESILPLVNDIVLVDGYSQDDTVAICKKYKQVRLLQHEWMGYSETKNWGNRQAHNDWIISLDADEALSPLLASSIREWQQLQKPIPASFNRLTNYCGHWVRYSGWYPDTKTRIFDRRTTQWVGHVHEKLQLPEMIPVQHLKGDCLHYSYYTVAEHYNQSMKYSRLSAEAMYEKGKKAPWYKFIINPVFKFLSNYIFKLGFLDGITGFRIAKISTQAVYFKYKYLKKLQTQ